MRETICEEDILSQFDRLIDEGTVVYNEDYHTVKELDKGFLFEFRILSSLTTKPQAPKDQQKHSEFKHSGCRPGSDINVSGYEVATLGSTHVLAVNKFPAARPHLLILTQDGFRRQYEALNIDDIAAAHQVLSSLSGRQLLLFNCGINSGCSRMHKHMQVFPAPHPENFELWPDSTDQVVPFKFFIHYFRDGLPFPEEILAVYQSLLGQAAACFENIALDSEAAVPHNLIINRNWLLVIPRRAAGFEGADTNAAGMLGMVWVHHEERMKLWLNKGPADVLARIGVPADAN
ncbi:hypothetical protein N0V88_006785 [Collariella sp. IMI 366227]|nr:hypothetical protein N0V88_006785 [Collariella sp. IMI 366227]